MSWFCATVRDASAIPCRGTHGVRAEREDEVVTIVKSIVRPFKPLGAGRGMSGAVTV